jgi:hypothetical protein
MEDANAQDLITTAAALRFVPPAATESVKRNSEKTGAAARRTANNRIIMLAYQALTAISKFYLSFFPLKIYS